MKKLNCIEICAGAGGQALGLEMAGFEPLALVEMDAACCATLRHNRPHWRVLEQDVHEFSGMGYPALDLFAGGVPCPPFSRAGKQLGEEDERNLFGEALRLIDFMRPKAVMLENVRGFLDAVFEDYRNKLKHQLEALGYVCQWRLLNASDYGVPQLRPRVVIVALQPQYAVHFMWPEVKADNPPCVGTALLPMMAANGWRGAEEWATSADDIAPTIVGGSKKHGGPDLGPTRAKRAWAGLGVDGRSIAEQPPPRDFCGMPRLTVPMVAKLQGFPADWHFTGRKTAAYRQVGNAFPPPVACAVARQIYRALTAKPLLDVQQWQKESVHEQN